MYITHLYKYKSYIYINREQINIEKAGTVKYSKIILIQFL